MATHDAPPSLQRAKRLVTSNVRQTRELFVPDPVSSVLQFPIAADPTATTVGYESVYRNLRAVNADHTHAPKRPRTPPSSPLQTVHYGNPQAAGKEDCATPAVASAPDGAAVREVELESAHSNHDRQPPKPGDAFGPLALVPAKRARTESAALVAGDVPTALADDRPQWHAPWKMFRGISGHLGWVRSVAVDASNEWFATGSSDRTVKIWDLASGRLKLTLTGHISAVRGIAISPRHPYMFTVGEDKTVKCWDLEQNKVIRNYHGHLSGVYCVSLHPTLDVLMTGGRDSTVRVWDIRTRQQVFVLGGHRDTVNALVTQPVDPQIISSSVDSTVRMWDLAAGKCSAILTNHKKGVRSLVLHPREFSFASASADNIKTWALPTGSFMRNLSGQHDKKLVNALAINEDGVLVSGGDDGSLGFWDYGGAHCFQSEKTIVQPGSLDCEAGIYALAFDRSGSRLITCEADKTIKMWKEDDSATPESHPLKWKPDLERKRY